MIRFFFKNIYKVNQFFKQEFRLPFFMNTFIKERGIFKDHPYVLLSKGLNNSPIIIYLHGGSFVLNINTMHWLFIKDIINHSGHDFLIVDYPLAPQENGLSAYKYIYDFYQYCLRKYPDKDFILMGDSAGANLALALTQRLRDEKIKQVKEAYLLSGLYDLRLNHPDIEEIRKHDFILDLDETKACIKAYCADIDVSDKRLSPLLNDCSHLPKLNIYTSKKDICYPDTIELIHKLDDDTYRLYVDDDALHDWIIMPYLKSSKDARMDIINKLKTNT